jgi:beta-ribofuranosylaminobenzene 5'-phosphate synthase
MIRVWTPSRLHFGLLSLAAEGEVWPARSGGPVLAARRFGGVGLMISAPGVCVRAAEAAGWSAEGPLAGRAVEFARRFAERAKERGVQGPPQHITVERAAPEHAGLGTGTQLGLAVGRALAEAWGMPADTRQLAGLVGRGLRSGLGVHGFEQGGFLVEAGKLGEEELSPLVVRLPFPETWRIVLAVPSEEPGTAAGLHGPDERSAFARLAHGAGLKTTETLCRLVLLELLPALAAADLEAFGEALFDFNARVGEVFAPVQGGIYAGPRVAEIVAFLRDQGVRGVGQSSWGPAVFAVAADTEQADEVVERLRRRFALGPAGAFVTQACNHGATVESG